MVTLMIWDILGQRGYTGIQASSYRGAEGAMIVCDLTRKETFASIASGMPRAAAAGQRTPASSEAGLLQRFAQGGRKSIRRIFKECPNALAKYKPCVP